MKDCKLPYRKPRMWWARKRIRGLDNSYNSEMHKQNCILAIPEIPETEGLCLVLSCVLASTLALAAAGKRKFKKKARILSKINSPGPTFRKRAIAQLLNDYDELCSDPENKIIRRGNDHKFEEIIPKFFDIYKKFKGLNYFCHTTDFKPEIHYNYPEVYNPEFGTVNLHITEHFDIIHTAVIKSYSTPYFIKSGSKICLVCKVFML